MLLIVAATDSELRGAAAIADCELLACGIGPVDAGIAVADRLAREPRPSAILHVGIAGARRAVGLEPGHLVLGIASTYCDTTSQLVSREIAPDDVLLANIHQALPDAVVTTIGTSADVGGTSDCDVEAMEGFAVLRAAARAGIPAIEVRTIANEIEESDRSKWYFDEALDALASAVPVVARAIVSPHDVS